MAACFTYSLVYVYTVYAVYDIAHLYSLYGSLHYLQSCVRLYGLCCLWHHPHIQSPWQLNLPTVLCTYIRSMLSMTSPTYSLHGCLHYLQYCVRLYGRCCLWHRPPIQSPWQLALPTVLCTYKSIVTYNIISHNIVLSMLYMASPTYTVSMTACFTYSLEYVYTVYAVYGISHIFSLQGSLHFLQSCVRLYIYHLFHIFYKIHFMMVTQHQNKYNKKEHQKKNPQ